MITSVLTADTRPSAPPSSSPSTMCYDYSVMSCFCGPAVLYWPICILLAVNDIWNILIDIFV